MKSFHSFPFLLAWALTVRALVIPRDARAVGYTPKPCDWNSSLGHGCDGPSPTPTDETPTPSTPTSTSTNDSVLLETDSNISSSCSCSTDDTSTSSIPADSTSTNAVSTIPTSTFPTSTIPAPTSPTSFSPASTSSTSAGASSSSPSTSSSSSGTTIEASTTSLASSIGTHSSSGTVSSTGTASSAAEATPTPGVINFDINLTNGGALSRSIAYVASVNLSSPDNGSSDNEFWVQLDTRFADLWIETNDLPAQNDGQDHSWLNITDGRSWAAGNMSYAPVKFGGYSIPNQIFLNSNGSSGFGTQGVLGLGFDTNSFLVSQYMTDHNLIYTGSLTPLTNIINQNFNGSNGPGFITLDVNHCPGIEAPEMYFDDNNDDTKTIGNGTLTIGSVLPQYASAMDSAPHLTVPQRPSQSEDASVFFDFWHVPVDGVAFGDQKYDISADGVDRNVNTTTALIDSGSSLSIVSQSLAHFIYSNIENSTHCEKEGSKTNVLWLVPCTSTPHVSFAFGGQDIRIDPLALTDVVQLKQNGSDHVACIGTFRAYDTPTGLDEGTPYNYTLGDPFLRNVYTRFDYGSATTDNDFTDPPAPFISFVSKVNDTDDTINANFAKTRGQTLQFFADKKMTDLQPNDVKCDSLAAYYL